MWWFGTRGRDGGEREASRGLGPLYECEIFTDFFKKENQIDFENLTLLAWHSKN